MHSVGNQAYKLELPKWRFPHISAREKYHNEETGGRENSGEARIWTGSNDEEYKVEGICDSMLYAKESEAGHLLGLYYLLSWKSYPNNKSTCKPASIV